jgi:hypothetical protein
MSQLLHIEDWAGWSAAARSQPADPAHNLDARIGTPILPAMLRRRLDQAGRATCEILGLLAAPTHCPLIYASRHGDVSGSLGMLSAIARAEDLSPARLYMSVHNAVMGVYSIARNHQGPIQALSASGDEFEALLWEAQGYLAAGHDSVVIVFSEGEMPPEYQEYAEHPADACVVGLRLTAERGQALRPIVGGRSARPTPLDVIAWLDSPDAVLAARQGWQLEHI